MFKRIVCLHLKKSIKDMNIESDVKIWLILIIESSNMCINTLERLDP